MGLLANCMSSERFMESFGQIPMDLEVYFDKDYANSEMDHVIEDVEKIGSIKEYIAMGSDYVTLNGTSIWCGYYKNLSGIEKSVSKGRAPKYDNENGLYKKLFERTDRYWYL